MAGRQEVERAKKRFLAETEDREWLQAVGVGHVEGKVGLVISVRPGAKAAVGRLLDRLDLDVPVSVRTVEEIRARAPERRSSDRDSIDALRKAALSRLDKSHR